MTETALLDVLSEACAAADAGQITLLGLLDLSAAFDTIDHGILIERLRHSYGITGDALGWMTTYLTGRTQAVYFNGEFSTTMVVTCGIPQGSVLGPLNFILYSADVLQVIAIHGFSVHGMQTTFRYTTLDIHFSRRRLSPDSQNASRMSTTGWLGTDSASTHQKRS